MASKKVLRTNICSKRNTCSVHCSQITEKMVVTLRSPVETVCLQLRHMHPSVHRLPTDVAFPHSRSVWNHPGCFGEHKWDLPLLGLCCLLLQLPLLWSLLGSLAFPLLLSFPTVPDIKSCLPSCSDTGVAALWICPSPRCHQNQMASQWWQP